MKENYFCLVANCVPVKGHQRSIIYDLIRNDFSFIPNELYNILTTKHNKSINSIIKHYDIEERQTIKEYFTFLLDKEYIFLCKKNEKKRFPPINFNFSSPYTLSNAIIEIDTISLFNFREIFSQLSELGNINIQLRFISKINLDNLNNILNQTHDLRIGYIELIIPYDDNLKEFKIKHFLKKHLRISKIIIYNAPKKITLHSNLSKISLTKKDLSLKENCGKIDFKYHIIELSFFNESQQYNSCLNQKICISKNGDLMNCLHINKKFGNINKDKIANVVNSKSFQQFWKLRKDDIEICKICEFRYMCSDCRAGFKTDNETKTNKPKKCTYDPLSNTFKN